MNKGEKRGSELIEELEEMRRHMAELDAREKGLVDRIQKLEGLEHAKADPEAIYDERMEVLERFAKGVAHNFNNILVGVLGYAQIIEMQSKDPETVEMVGKIVESAMRAKELVNRLNLSVRASKESNPRRVDVLNSLVEEAAHRTEAAVKEDGSSPGIEIVARLEDVPPVKGTPEELRMILDSLLGNAVEATTSGGRIEVSTASAQNQVELKVKDRGIGMDEETRERIFEPFFTTKKDVGSGLSLSIVHQLITGWGGSVEVETSPGGGSTFSLLIPLWEDAELEEVGGRVIVIDDDAAVLEVVKIALEPRVVEAVDNGETGLARFEEGKYDVALIDLAIPGIPGDEIARRMKEIDPTVRTVLITGLIPEDGDARLSPFDFQLQKPFRVAEIRNLVEKAVTSRA